jgi:hypothetical protein
MAPEVPSPELDLRPLTTGELIDRGFTLYRQNFAGLLLLALLGQAAPLLVQVLTSNLHLMPTQNAMIRPTGGLFLDLGLYFCILMLSQLVSFAFEVIMTCYVADAYLGRLPSMKKGFRRWAGCWLGSIWTCVLNLILYAATLVFPILALVALEVWYVLAPPASFAGLLLFLGGTLVLTVLSLVPPLIVFMRLMVTVSVLAMEGLSGWAACRRSSALVRYDPKLGFFYWGETRLSLLLLPLFVIQLLTSTLTSVPMIIAQINESVRHGTTTALANPSDAVVVGSQILTYLAGALILPLYIIAVTLFYYDVRIRREGFDLEFLAGRLEGSA